MKIFLIIPVLFMAGAAYADCVEIGTFYSSCKPGYYLSNNDCIRCPSSGGVYGTTVDNNTGDITSCYLPSGTSGSDATGTWQYTSDCYYSN